MSSELGVNVELSAQSNGHAGFVEIFNVQGRAGSTNETARFTDVNGVTNLAADNSELVVIVAVNFRSESKFILQNHQRFVGDLGNREQIICHFDFPLKIKN